MPQGETFWNPYRMIPVRNRVERKAPVTDEKFTGRSGSISCSLQNLTSIFVGRGNDSSLQSLRFIKRDGRYVIPGSSLKGMLRSLAEIVGGGCLVTSPSGPGDRYQILDDSYKACGNYRSLCITCRMFGMMARGQGARMHKGKISISDALIREKDVRVIPFEILLMNHGTRHRVFYENPETDGFDCLCRKMYFHQPLGKEQVPVIPQAARAAMRDGGIQKIEALTPEHNFRFDVQFTNLELDELKLLVYSLVLEDDIQVTIGNNGPVLNGPMRHKIGMAKPLGLGSCRIFIDRLVYLPDAAVRFSSLTTSEAVTFEGRDLVDEVERLTDGIVRDESPTMQHLRKMMIWNETDTRNFHYPDYTWFRNPENAAIRLKNI